MASFNGLFFSYVLLVCYQISAAEKVMRPKLVTNEVWSNEEYVKQKIAMNINDPHLNVTVDVLKEISNVDFHVECKIWKRSDPSYFVSINSTFNLCVILNMKKQSSIDALIVMLLREYGRLPDNCPVPRGRYGVQKFWLPESSATAALPELDFDLHIHAFKIEANKERIMLAKDHFEGQGVIMDVNNLKMGFMNRFG